MTDSFNKIVDKVLENRELENEKRFFNLVNFMALTLKESRKELAVSALPYGLASHPGLANMKALMLLMEVELGDFGKYLKEELDIPDEYAQEMQGQFEDTFNNQEQAFMQPPMSQMPQMPQMPQMQYHDYNFDYISPESQYNSYLSSPPPINKMMPTEHSLFAKKHNHKYPAHSTYNQYLDNPDDLTVMDNMGHMDGYSTPIYNKSYDPNMEFPSQKIMTDKLKDLKEFMEMKKKEMKEMKLPNDYIEDSPENNDIKVTI